MYDSDVSLRTRIIKSEFEYLDEHIELLNYLSLESTQLDRGKYSSREIVVPLSEDCLVRFTSHRPRIIHRSVNISNNFEFCIPLKDSSTPQLLSFESSQPTIAFTSPGQDKTVITPSSFTAASVAISKSRFDKLTEGCTQLPGKKVLSQHLPQLSPTDHQMAILRQLLLSFYHQVAGFDELDAVKTTSLMNLCETSIIPLLLEIYFQSHNRQFQARPSLLQMAIEIIISNIDSPPNIFELAAMLHTSQRNLQYIFRAHLGVSPKQFIQLYRLNLARKRLWNSRAQRGAITDIANSLGYWHMGAFAHDFRRLFDMKPRDFLKGVNFQQDDVDVEN